MSHDSITSMKGPVQSTPAPAAPVKSAKDRLAEALVAAQKLLDDAEWLQIETDELFGDLNEIAKGPTVPRYDIDAVLDAACWLKRATENVEGEFSALIGSLEGALEA